MYYVPEMSDYINIWSINRYRGAIIITRWFIVHKLNVIFSYASLYSEIEEHYFIWYIFAA